MRSLLSVIVGALAAAILVVAESSRRRRYLKDPTRYEEPTRIALWTFTPASLMLTIGAIVSLALGWPAAAKDIDMWELAELFFVTAFGEELIFRGILLGMALVATTESRVRPAKDRTRTGFWIVSLAFGLWHVADAVLLGQANNYSGGAIAVWTVGNVLATTLASILILIPLRLRSGNVYAPSLVHLAANAPGVIAGARPIP